MAYSNVGTPVFYVDNCLYHKTIGTELYDPTPAYEDADFVTPTTIHNYPNLYTLNPAIAQATSGGVLSFSSPLNDKGYDFTGNMNWYFAFLNHNFDFFKDVDEIDVYMYSRERDGENENNLSLDVISNSNYLKGSSIFELADGENFSYFGLSDNSHITFLPTITPEHIKVGALSSGIKYTMPHSPDLKLSMEIEMDGIDTITTSGGASISNIKYTGNPLWVSEGLDWYENDYANYTNPFEIYEDTDGYGNYTSPLDVRTTGARRNGRKSWNLKFSYINDRDLFSSNLGSTGHTEHGNDSTYHEDDLEDDKLYFNIETDDSFYAQVWNKTLGGALPFIFQPDSNFRDEFYICKFDQDSLKVSQSAYKVYDISVKIVEVW